MGGVALVQISGLTSSGAPSHKGNIALGLASVLSACCSSGFASVYFEKVLKGSEISVWMRNIELSVIGIFVGLMGVYCTDKERVAELGFFSGYNKLVWAVIALQAFGGIIVANVVKYADNLLKGFATSISVVLSCLVSIFLFDDFTLSFKFILGTSLVLLSTLMYSTSVVQLNLMLGLRLDTRPRGSIPDVSESTTLREEDELAEVSGIELVVTRRSN